MLPWANIVREDVLWAKVIESFVMYGLAGSVDHHCAWCTDHFPLKFKLTFLQGCTFWPPTKKPHSRAAVGLSEKKKSLTK